MTPTNLQNRNLELYAKYRNDRPCLRNLIAFNRARYYPIFVIMAIGVIFLVLPDFHIFGIIIISMTAGVLIRDLGFFRHTVLIWPLVQEIIDWNKVDQLINKKSEQDGPPNDPPRGSFNGGQD